MNETALWIMTIMYVWDRCIIRKLIDYEREFV